MSIGMRDSNEHMIAGIIGIIPHKVAVLIILSTLTLEINRISSLSIHGNLANWKFMSLMAQSESNCTKWV